MVQKLPLQGGVGGDDYLLVQGGQLGQPGDREEAADPTGGSGGNGVLLACEEKRSWSQGMGSAGGKGARRSCPPGRVRGAGHRSAAAQACWHKSQLQHGRYFCERAQLSCCWHRAPLSGIQLPWRLLVPRATYLGHCKLAGPAGAL